MTDLMNTTESILTNTAPTGSAEDMNLPTIPAPTQQDPVPAAEPTLDEATIQALKDLGFDHVPTVDELREAKARRQAEVREEVLFQADRRNWCDDGTRQVCANLRVARPGRKEERAVKATVTLEIEFNTFTWTERGALAAAMSGGILPEGGGRNWHGARVVNASYADVTVGDTPYELTEDLRKELGNG